MKSYYRVMLGKKSIFAETCFNEGFIGADFEINQDLSNDLPENWRRKLPQIENNIKIEASISLRRRDEEVKVHGEPDCWNLG